MNEIIDWIRQAMGKIPGDLFSVILLSLMVAALLISGAFAPEGIDRAERAIKNHYADHNIYKDTRCQTEEFEKHWFVFCADAGRSIGGLYLIEPFKESRYRIFTMNDKARSHSRRSQLPIFPRPARFSGINAERIINEAFL